MNPIEAAIRAACRAMGADPESWRGFREIGKAAADALVDALPLHPEQRAELRHYLDFKDKEQP